MWVGFEADPGVPAGSHDPVDETIYINLMESVTRATCGAQEFAPSGGRVLL